MNSPQRSWKLFTIPNMLSFFRILLIGPIIYCIMQEQAFYIRLGLVLIVIAILTDYLDGILARKLHQISEFGKILDPLADKLAVASLIVVLVIYKGFPMWAAAIIIGRDVLILLAGLIWATKHKFVTSSNLLGKWTVFFIALMILVYVIGVPILEKVLTYNAAFFTILSGIVYLKKYIDSMKMSALY